MIKLFRCKICGNPYIGEEKPSRCPFCGAKENFMVEAKDYKETFDVELNEKDRANAEKALELEISNTIFYFCAAEKTDNEEGKQLFKALGKVEAEHASIWRKILKLPKEDMGKSDECAVSNQDNLKESHDREEKAIEFYSKAAVDSENTRVKQIFAALTLVEKDHLQLSGERIKS
ncbi:MAG: ferritin [Candidatus Diapherotrites archaeon]|uniref:Ferritin n=1 Tax=Candidatus Iainarchaeum sp. TaxID=3101447 RepID=A0A2D6M1Y6_9ARCH|nr:ferritin [Candidatus Diapherotrites archaeon]|tara:strand:+ start:2036 stop:2560 length:525 start_codon:yes stop_codon:yes gene_type:complete